VSPMWVKSKQTAASYYRARYYDSITGRFISEEPIGFYGGFDFYSYVRSDPADSPDPSGLCGICDDIPPHLPDASVDANMAVARQNGYSWWFNTVKTSRGAWDYKWYHGQNTQSTKNLETSTLERPAARWEFRSIYLFAVRDMRNGRRSRTKRGYSE
jgi:RHS repeat-associated protein